MSILSVLEVESDFQYWMRICCFAVLYIMLAVCIYTDGKEGKIYNKVLIPGFLSGILLNFIGYGTDGLVSCLISLTITLVFFLPFYLLKGIGAGDIKLIATCSVLVNVFYTAGALIVATILAAIFATFKWLKTRKARVRIRYGVFIGIGFYLYQVLILIFG